MRDFRNRRNQTWVCPFQTCRVRRSCEVNRASSRALIESVAKRVTSGPLSFMSRSCRPDLSRTCWTRLKGSPFRALARKLLLFFALLFLSNFTRVTFPFILFFKSSKRRPFPTLSSPLLFQKSIVYFSFTPILVFVRSRIAFFQSSLSLYTKETRSIENNYHY